MTKFSFEEIGVDGAYLVTSFSSDDNRGSFVKNYENNTFLEAGINFNCTESFISHSYRNVVRGIHFQLYHPQAKLVGVISGKVYDVIVDLRKDSKTYGQYKGYYLSDENRCSLLIPRGCGHCFVSFSYDSVVSYACDGEYNKETDTGIIWNDKSINIDWPVENADQLIVGERDQKLMTFKEFDEKCDFIY